MDEERKQSIKNVAIPIVIFILVVVSLHIIRKQSEKDVKDAIRENNKIWIEELDKRDLIIKNDKGGFQWK